MRKMKRRIILGLLVGMLWILGVSVSADNLKLNHTKVSISNYESIQLKVIGNNKALNIKWKSDNSKIASVNSKGIVLGKKAGNCTVSATIGRRTYKCYVTVKSNKVVDVSKVSNMSAVRAAKGLELKTAEIGSVCTYTKNGKIINESDVLRVYKNLRNDSYGLWWFSIYSNAYSVYGTRVGMTMNEAKNKLIAKDWKVISDYSYPKIRVCRLEKDSKIVFFYIDDITRGNRITSIVYYNYHPSPCF